MKNHIKLNKTKITELNYDTLQNSANQCIHQLFEKQVEKTPEAIAVVIDDQKITYNELNQKANQLAHHLISLGAKPDMLIGICMERSIDLIIGLLGILKAGGAYLPIDLSYPQDRLAFMIEDANTSLLITQKSLSENIPNSKATNIYLDEFDFDDNDSSNPDVKINSDNLAYVIYTSGSTGKPNGVMVTHKNVVRLFQSTEQWFKFNEKDIWSFFHSYAFDFSVWEIWGAIIYGGKVVVVPYLLSRSPEAFYDLLVREKVTVLNQTPSAFYQLIQAESIKDSAENLALRYVIFGGEALNLAALKPWFEKHGDQKPQLINMYGITETTVHVTYRPLTSKDINSGSVIGIPIPDLKVYILNEQLKEVPVGETGEMYVGGAGLAKGYLNRPELNKVRFISNPFSDSVGDRLYKTGDLARRLEGNDIEYLGRIDHQVKIRGFRIELGEIENSIRNYNGIKDCVVTVHKYSEDVVRIIAYLVSDEEISNDQLKKHLTQFLPEYMIPNLYVNINKIPLTPNGKTDLKALPVPDQIAKKATGLNTSDESDELEKRLIRIWKELLGIEDIGLTDNFFDLGGNSLLMGRLQIRVNQTFHESISIVDLFQYPTISSLAKFIGRKIKSAQSLDRKEFKKRNLLGTDIAIIGMAGRYPKANNIQEFWQNLVDSVESISFFTEEELEYLPKGNLNSELKFVKARGILDNVDKFDAEFFSYNPREAAIMDPQHRIFLECAWNALEDAGYCSDKYKGSIGVFAGSSLNTYLMYNVLKDRESSEEMANGYQIADYMTLTGNDNAFLTTKVAYKLGLTGPAVNVQTACSTSLVAIGQAYQSLISGQCDMALAGGVSITFPQKRGYFFVDGSIGSEDGHCKAFDADATGTVFGHGAGIIVMKRLDEAIKDGDSIYAVIKSVAVNNDGSDKAGYMTPSVEGQSEVILKAQQLAGVEAETIKYVETHGTGTPVGDPIEVASLEKAFRTTTDAKQFCGIGSVKSNLGHTDAAAGVTGVLKTALSLYNRVIPPTIHYKNPNPRIDFANSPFYVVDKLTSLDGMQRPLRAAVSAFGVGGTNAHAILEEFPYISFSCEEDRDKYLLIVSAKTETALLNNMNALKDYLKNNPAEAINDIAYTLQEGRKEFEWRQFIIADNCTDAFEEISGVINSGMNKGKFISNEKPHLVFMFPGQGAQYVNMGKGLYNKENLFREIVDNCAEILKPYLGLDIRELLFPQNDDQDSAKKLEQTVYTQPALFIIEYALAQLLISRGIKPASMIGHSVGEYVAACIAGVFSLEDALFILSMRAKLMQQQVPGSMLSVRSGENEIKEYLNEDISLAAINSPNLLVLSGETEKIKALSEKLSAKSIENKMLFTSHAYHSRLMEPALKPFISEFTKIKLNKPNAPFISSLSGTWITDEQATDPNYWAAQLRNAVRFSNGILELHKKKNLVMIELGPGRALSTMASQHRSENVKQTVITTLVQPNEKNDDVSNFLTAVGKLWLAGLKIDWSSFYRNKKRRRLHLPGYQFDRKSYWIEAPKSVNNNIQISNSNQGVNRVKKLIKKPKVKKVVQETTMTRKDYIINILKDVLEDLSGIKKSELDESKTFLELGFDSLFMTQVSLAFQKKFDVKITLRQLLETTPTIFTIAEFIDSKLPAGKFEPPKQEVVIEEESEEIMEEYEESVPTDLSQSNIQYQSGNSAVERLVYEQLEIMKKQLEVLSGKGTKSTIEPQLHLKKKTEDTATPVEHSTVTDSAIPLKQEKKVFERFGPYKPIETKKGGALTEKQQKYLNKLIDEYTKKTKSSKKLTQEHRAHYSDPRTVSGFLPIWKEMTYQVVTNKSEGSKLWDLDGNEYIDVIMGFGQYLFGHNPKFVRDAVEQQLKLGFEIGPQSPIAGEVARLICEFTNFDRAAFCVTGSEAVLGAIRAARTVTGKDKIVFFAGDYHGIIDEVLIKTTVNGDQVRSMPIAPGIPRENVQNTIALEYGSEESLRIIEKLLPEIGGIMVEPVQARRPDLQPKEFLQKLRKITEDANIPLIFDEVITGFRSAQGGAQEWFGIKADIGTFGKVLGGGFPIGIIAGKKLYMDAFDGGYWQYGDDSIPEAGVTFFAGTFARHPLSLTACYAVLKYLKSKEGNLQKGLNQKAKQLSEELNSFMLQRNVPIKVMNFSSVIYYSYPKDLNYFSLLFYVLRNKGIHILEGFPMFLSEAHSDEDIKHIIDAFKESIIELQDNGFFPAPLNGDGKKVTENSEDKPNDVNRFPLAEAQKEMWIGAQMRPEAAGPHHACTGLYLDGNLNIEVLKRAIESVIKKHEGLRSTIVEDGSEAIVNPTFVPNIPVLDLSTLPADQQEKRVDEIFHKEAQRFLDLKNGPLAEFQILKLSPDRHILILTAQMIICDGWSHYVVFEDLSAFYNAFINNSEPKLEAAVPMHEYANWEKNNKGSIEEKECEEFWLSQFKTIPPSIDLPSSRLRPPTRTFEGDRRTIKISEELYSSIKRIGKEQKSSSFAILFAAFNVWLSRLSGIMDLVVGVPFAAQSPLGMDRLVGQCANTLPLRIQLDPGEPFSSVLKKTWESVLDAQENWNFSYGRLITKLNIPLEPSRIPLVSILFNIDPPMDKVKFSGLKHKFVTGPRYYFQYDLGFNLVEDETTVNVECDYNSNLFDGKVIEKWIEGYKAILETIVQGPDSPIDKLPMISKQDEYKLLAFESNLNKSQPNEHNFIKLFKAQVKNSPNNIAVKTLKESLTYLDLNNHSDQIGNHLLALGVKPETIVGICLNRTTELPIAILAIIKSGGAYILLDPEKSVEDIEKLIHQIGIEVVISDEQSFKKLNGKCKHIININQTLGEENKKTNSFSEDLIKPGNLVCLIPKNNENGITHIVEITHNSLVNCLESLQNELAINTEDLVLYHSAYSTGYEFVELLLPLIVGAKSIIYPDINTKKIEDLQQVLNQQKVTTLLLTPSGWKKLFDLGWKPKVEFKALCTGELLRSDIAENLMNISKDVWNLYGTIETSVFSMVNKVIPDSKNILGKPVDNSNVIIVDSQFRPVPVDVPGEILISGSGLARGYYNDITLTSKKFLNLSIGNLRSTKYFRTGDLARYKIDGGIEFLSPIKRRIHIRGFSFEAKDIEKALVENPAVSNALVVQKQFADGELRLVAYLVINNNAISRTTELIKNLHRFLRSKFPDYMIPGSFVVLDQIPLKKDGRVDYEALPAPKESDSDFADFVAPRNKTEEMLATIWSELLKIPKVSVKDSFFDLGGQSLLAVRLFNRIDEEFGQRFPLAMLFKAPTIEDLANKLINKEDNNSEWPSLIPIQPRGSKAPLFLVHGAGGNVLLYNALAKHMEPDYPLYGLQSQGLDGKSKPLNTVEEMAERYLQEIKTVQPHGPYFLGGYCLGGTIAYEMAQRLIANGEQVPMVAMLDTYNFVKAQKVSFASFLFQKLKFHIKNFTQLSPEEMIRYFKEKKRIAGDGGWAHIKTEMPGTTLADNDSFGRAESGIEASVQLLNDHAGDIYDPKPYSGKLTLFKPQKNYSFYPDPKMGWGDLVSELDIVEMPINPHAMLVEPYVEKLAHELKRRLNGLDGSISLTDNSVNKSFNLETVKM